MVCRPTPVLGCYLEARMSRRTVNNVRIQGHKFCFPVKRVFLINGV